MYAKKKRSASAVTRGRRGSRMRWPRLARHPATEARDHARGRYRLRFQDLGQDLRGREATQLGVGFEDEAVGEPRWPQRPPVIRGHETTTPERGSRLRPAEEAERPRPTGAQ